jgi:hypothetical protein
MKVFLDDTRATPEGWVRAYWPDEVIALLETGEVTELSLDHDLGDDNRGTGYDVLLWLEQAAFAGTLRIPEITIHSANAAAHQRMDAAVRSIRRLVLRAATHES